MSADVGLGGRDGQGRGQCVRVEGGLQHHQGPVHPALVEVVRKLLLRETREITRTSGNTLHQGPVHPALLKVVRKLLLRETTKMTPEETHSIDSEMEMVMLVIVTIRTPYTPLS